MLLRCVTVCYSSTEWSNCTVNPTKHGKENQGIHFHHYCQAHLIHYFGQEKMPLTHVIQSIIWVRPGYFTNWVRPAWLGQNVSRLTQITRMTQPDFNPFMDTLRPFISILIILVNLYAKASFGTINKCVDYAGVLIFNCLINNKFHFKSLCGMKWLCQKRQYLVLASLS